MTGTDLDKAIECLVAGGLVAIPTETVYGLGANAFDAQAVTEIFEAKNRPQFNPLIIHTDSVDRLRSWGLDIPPAMEKLAAKFSPGPLTYVIPKSDHIPDIVTAGHSAVAVRIPDHPLTLELLKRLSFPVAAPSANPSGFVSPTTAAHVHEQLGNRVAYILDGGPCRVGVESTIISFLEPVPRILRFGGLAIEEIQAVVGKVEMPSTGENEEAIVAPGMLLKHYGTRHKLATGDVNELLKSCDPSRTAIISFHTCYPGVPDEQQHVLSPDGDAAEAARNLFAAMRKADLQDVDVILAEKFPDEGLCRAINDRLQRASR